MDPELMPPDPASAADPGAMPDDTATAPAMGGGEICVPLAALAMPDDKEQNVTPAVGDKSSANLDYTVTRVEGDNAYITVDGINGTKIDSEDKADGGNDDASEEASIRASLGGDQGNGGYQP